MRRLVRNLLVAVLSFVVVETAAAQTEPRRVLLLQSFGRNYTAWNSIALRLEEGLIKHSSYRINVYRASIESERLGPSYDAQPYMQYLRTLFAEQNPDLVIAVGAPAARFMLTHRASLFRTTPLLLTGTDPRTFADLSRSSADVVIPVVLDHARQVDNILQLLPQTRHIAVVVGNSAVERFWLDELKRTFEPYQGKIIFEYFNNLTLDAVVRRVADLPEHSAVYFGSFRVDAQGVSYAEERVLTQLKEATRAPIFTFTDSNFGMGIVGGPMLSIDDISRQSAEVAERLLRGEKAASIATTTILSGDPRYDGRELDRWNIDQDRLPEGSRVYFREPGAWKLYRLQITAICTALLLQAGLISWLIYEHRRRTLAEVQSRGLMTELAHMNRVATAGELSASIAHEINQPLTGILTRVSAAVRWLTADPPDLAKVRELLVQIVNAGDRAAAIISSIRAMFAKGAADPRPVDLKQLITSVLALVRMDLQKNNIELVLHFGEPPLVVRGDKTQLQQVVLNLVINAIEAMHASETRVLRLDCDHRDADTLLVSIEDTGGGIDAEHLKRIFDPLFTTKLRGMGMGLSICRSIVENHGGRIRVTPAASGGSVFSFDLPAYKGERALGPTLPQRAGPATAPAAADLEAAAAPRRERAVVDTD